MSPQHFSVAAVFNLARNRTGRLVSRDVEINHIIDALRWKRGGSGINLTHFSVHAALRSIFWVSDYFYQTVFISLTNLKGTDWVIPWEKISKTAHSHLISDHPFPRPNTAARRGKWERNINFPLRLRRMCHSVDGFCRIGSPETNFSFFFGGRNVG